MNNIARELDFLIETHRAVLQNKAEKEMVFKPSPIKWSRKEILGHLCDSAQNNIRRFIVAQYEELPFIVYNQDKWVTIVNYQEYDKNQLADLWFLLNKQIVSILNNTPAEMWQRQCQAEQPHTIEWLATDYIKHLRHHLHQILDLEPFAYP